MIKFVKNIFKVNELERHLMAATKENAILKGDIIDTKQKLTSIEDNSFGSNDMVIALKRDLESSEQMKLDLFDKIATLERELEAAAEDGLELNRMVSELLSSQTGSDSIISSVEDLQRQLNEQEGN
jgi:chromosome segregation ATPase